MSKELLPFPKFYIKAVGGTFSVEHRLTHTTMGSVKEEKDLYDEMEMWVEMPEEDLWRFLLEERSARIVPQKDFDMVFEQQEKMYFGAWGVYTSKFFLENQELYEEVLSNPVDLLNKMRKEKNDIEQAKYQENRRQIEETERLLTETRKTEKKVKAGGDRIAVVDNTIKIGDKKKILKIGKIKKAKPKVKIKKKSGKQKLDLPLVGDNPFD